MTPEGEEFEHVLSSDSEASSAYESDPEDQANSRVILDETEAAQVEAHKEDQGASRDSRSWCYPCFP